MPSLRLRPTDRLLAWLVTGPIGHLVAGLIDCAVLVWWLARTRIRRSGRW